MPLGSGRKKGWEWQEVSDSGEKGKVVCDHCTEVVSEKVERVRGHLMKCRKRNTENNNVSVGVGGSEGGLVGASLGSSSSEAEGTSSDSDSSEIMPSPKKLKGGNISKFVFKTSKVEERELNKLCARFFFACNIPFKVAGNKEFQKFASSLRPGYVPPSRKQISRELLEEVYSDVDKVVKKGLYDKDTIILCQDGWSNTQNDPIIAHSFHDGSKSYLLNIVDCGASKKTGEYCFKVIDEAIDELREEYSKEVFAVCTDNENKMKKMKDLVSNKYPDMLCYGCSAHYANLLEKDVSLPAVTKHVVEVNKYFRNVHVAHGLLKEKGGRMPQIPNDTRWNSEVDCLESFKDNHNIFMEIRAELMDDMPNN